MRYLKCLLYSQNSKNLFIVFVRTLTVTKPMYKYIMIVFQKVNFDRTLILFI